MLDCCRFYPISKLDNGNSILFKHLTKNMSMWCLEFTRETSFELKSNALNACYNSMAMWSEILWHPCCYTNNEAGVNLLRSNLTLHTFNSTFTYKNIAAKVIGLCCKNHKHLASSKWGACKKTSKCLCSWVFMNNHSTIFWSV